MSGEEKIYFRKSINQKCNSSQIANSILAGRIGMDEVFILDSNDFNVDQLIASDRIIRTILVKSNYQLPRFKKNSTNYIYNKIKLLKKIISSENNLLISLILSNESKEEKILNLNRELESAKSELEKLSNKNKNLNELELNFRTKLEELYVLFSYLKNKKTINADLTIIANATDEILELLESLIGYLGSRMK